MARITLQEFVERGVGTLPSTRKCRDCGEDGLIWDQTRDGKPWLYSVVVIGDSDAKAQFALGNPEKFADLTAKGLIRETSTDGFVIVAKWGGGAHICPAHGPDAQATPLDETVVDDDDLVVE